MPQQILPIFIEGTHRINDKIHYEYSSENDTVCYFLYCLPFYSHPKSDKNCFKMLIGQLVTLGHCRNCELEKALGLTKNYVIRAVKQYREGGAGSFFAPRTVRSASVLTPQVLAEAQQLLSEGKSRPEVAKQLSLKPNTLSKAVQDGRLIEKKSPAASFE